MAAIVENTSNSGVHPCRNCPKLINGGEKFRRCSGGDADDKCNALICWDCVLSGEEPEFEEQAGQCYNCVDCSGGSVNTVTAPENVRVRPTDEEWRAYLDEKYPNRPTCCFCGQKTDCPYGNNPAPLRSKGVCCGTCNQVVIFVRMGLMSNPFGPQPRKKEASV